MNAQQTFDAANAAFSIAAKKYNGARLAFRANEISAEAFCAARKEFDAALAAWTEAEAVVIAAKVFA